MIFIVQAIEAFRRKAEAVEASNPDPHDQLAAAMSHLADVLERKAGSSPIVCRVV